MKVARCLVIAAATCVAVCLVRVFASYLIQPKLMGHEPRIYGLIAGIGAVLFLAGSILSTRE